MRDYGADIRSVLGSRSFQVVDERTVQDAIASAFEKGDLPFEREVRITERDRIDFVVAGEVGLEVKVQGGPSGVLRQLTRYARTGKVRSLILVTTLRKHGLVQTLWRERTVPLEVLVLHGGLL